MVKLKFIFGRKHVQNVSMNIASVVKIKNKCVAALILRIDMCGLALHIHVWLL